jgi:hypothetical protein
MNTGKSVLSEHGQKFVLGKDETPDSNSGLGSLSLLRPVVTGYFVGESSTTERGAAFSGIRLVISGSG